MKPGVKTSEFWITMALILVGGVLEVLGSVCGGIVPCGAWVQPVMIIGGVLLQLGSAAGYSVSRGAVKAGEAKAIVAKEIHALSRDDLSKALGG